MSSSALVEDKVEALLDAQAERTMSSRLTKGSTFRLSKKNHPSQIEQCSSFETLLAPSSYDESSQDEIALPVRSAILAADKRAAAKSDAEYYARKMMCSTMAHVPIRVTVHSEDDERRFCMLDVVESIRFLELISMIEARIGGALGNRKLFGITQAGEVFELMNGETFSLHKTVLSVRARPRRARRGSVACGAPPAFLGPRAICVLRGPLSRPATTPHRARAPHGARARNVRDTRVSGRHIRSSRHTPRQRNPRQPSE